MNFPPSYYNNINDFNNISKIIPNSPKEYYCHCSCCECFTICHCCHCQCDCHKNQILSSDVQINNLNINTPKTNSQIQNIDCNNYNSNSNNNINIEQYKEMKNSKSSDNLFFKRNNNQKISNDLENFNNELMALKMRLIDQKKYVKDKKNSLNSSIRTSSNNSYTDKYYYMAKNYVKYDNRNKANNDKKEINEENDDDNLKNNQFKFNNEPIIKNDNYYNSERREKNVKDFITYRKIDDYVFNKKINVTERDKIERKSLRNTRSSTNIYDNTQYISNDNLKINSYYSNNNNNINTNTNTNSNNNSNNNNKNNNFDNKNFLNFLKEQTKRITNGNDFDKINQKITIQEKINNKQLNNKKNNPINFKNIDSFRKKIDHLKKYINDNPNKNDSDSEKKISRNLINDKYKNDNLDNSFSNKLNKKSSSKNNTNSNNPYIVTQNKKLDNFLNKQNFKKYSFSINLNGNNKKDLIIESLKQRMENLTIELEKISNINLSNKKELELKDITIKIQKEEIEQLKISLGKSKVHINSLIEKLEKNQNLNEENDNKNILIKENLNSFSIKGFPYQDYYLKKITQTSNTSKKVLSSSYSMSKLMTKLNIENNLTIIPKKTNFSNFSLNNNLIYSIPKTNKNKCILCFDLLNKEFQLIKYADFNNFSSNYKYENEGNIFFINDSNFYIITGENCDMFYLFNPQKKSIEKLCSLNNNHSKGSLINYHNTLICLSGEFNKKVEMYSPSKNEWKEIPEMINERSNFSSCIFQDKYLFAFFGFNNPKKQYLNTIEFLDLLEEDKNWTYLLYENSQNLSLKIINFITINYNEEKIIFFGGYNKELEKPIDKFIQLIISQDLNNNYIEEVDRQFKDIEKNKIYEFNTNTTSYEDNLKRKYNTAIDKNNNVHIFEIDKMIHDVYSQN